MVNKICVIGLYFGNMPKYFPLWLKSAQANKEVDFFIFGNTGIKSDKNVKSYYMELDEIKSRAEKVLGFSVCLETPYKCCDYKPLYGLMFSDYVEKYDFWGHCDFDLIFGDIISFTNKYNLEDYDRFLALGHLSFYRNTDEVNNRYMIENSSVSYKQVFNSNDNFVFDENLGMTPIYLKNEFPFFYKLIFADIASIYDRYRIIESYNLDTKPQNYRMQIFYWDNGKVFRAYYKRKQLHKEEYCYIHFKKRDNFEVDQKLCEASAFYITKKGFFVKDKEVSKKDIKRYNFYKGAIYEFLEKIKYDMKIFFDKVKRKVCRNKKEQ